MLNNVQILTSLAQLYSPQALLLSTEWILEQGQDKDNN